MKYSKESLDILSATTRYAANYVATGSLKQVVVLPMHWSSMVVISTVWFSEAPVKNDHWRTTNCNGQWRALSPDLILVKHLQLSHGLHYSQLDLLIALQASWQPASEHQCPQRGVPILAPHPKIGLPASRCVIVHYLVPHLSPANSSTSDKQLGLPGDALSIYCCQSCEYITR
jgi:hypothetical protein